MDPIFHDCVTSPMIADCLAQLDVLLEYGEIANASRLIQLLELGYEKIMATPIHLRSLDHLTLEAKDLINEATSCTGWAKVLQAHFKDHLNMTFNLPKDLTPNDLVSLVQKGRVVTGVVKAPGNLPNNHAFTLRIEGDQVQVLAANAGRHEFKMTGKVPLKDFEKTLQALFGQTGPVEQQKAMLNMFGHNHGFEKKPVTGNGAQWWVSQHDGDSALIYMGDIGTSFRPPDLSALTEVAQESTPRMVPVSKPGLPTTDPQGRGAAALQGAAAGGVAGAVLGLVLGLLTTKDTESTVVESVKGGVTGATGGAANSLCVQPATAANVGVKRAIMGSGAVAAAAGLLVSVIHDESLKARGWLTPTEARQRRAKHIGGSFGGAAMGSGAVALTVAAFGVATGPLGMLGLTAVAVLGGVGGGIAGSHLGQEVDRAFFEAVEDRNMEAYEFFNIPATRGLPKPIVSKDELREAFRAKIGMRPDDEEWVRRCFQLSIHLLSAMFPAVQQLLAFMESTRSLNSQDGEDLTNLLEAVMKQLPPESA